MNYWDKNKIFEKLIIFSWVIFLFFCLFLLSFTSRAAQDQDYFPMEQNKNNHFVSDCITAIQTTFNDDDYYIFVAYRDYNYWLIRYPKSEKGYGLICGEKYNNLYQFSIYQLGSINTETYQFQFMRGSIVNQQYLGSNGWGYFQGLQSSNYNSNLDYISNFKVFTNNTTTKKVVLNYDDLPEYNDPDNDTFPNNFDKPDLSNYYNSDNAPIFDDSTTSSAIQSLYDILKWFFYNGVGGLIQYLVDSSNWAIQKVINNIRSVIVDLVNAFGDKIDNLIVGIGSKIDDIKDSIDYIIEPIDNTSILNAYNNTSFVSSINSISNIVNGVYSAFDISEPDNFILTIHVEQLRLLYSFGVRSPVVIDVGSYILPFRSTLRAFLWVIVSFGTIFIVEKGLSDWIRGENDRP